MSVVVRTETPVSDASDSVAVGLSDPLVLNGATGLANSAAYIALPVIGLVAGWRQQFARH